MGVFCWLFLYCWFLQFRITSLFLVHGRLLFNWSPDYVLVEQGQFEQDSSKESIFFCSPDLSVEIKTNQDSESSKEKTKPKRARLPERVKEASGRYITHFKLRKKR